jgi:hypothetical protein
MTQKDSELQELRYIKDTAWLRADSAPMENNRIDVGYLIGKEMEYCEKARAATNPKMQLAYEAAAREYACRATLLKEAKEMAV